MLNCSIANNYQIKYLIFIPLHHAIYYEEKKKDNYPY